jgi:hypothetical protein
LRVALLLAAAAALAADKAPVQPIPFSHKQHVSTAALKCIDCHTMPDPGEVAGIPAVSRCMACHVAVKKDSPAVQRVAEYAQQRRPIPWVRVYAIPSYVAFSHKSHVEGGVNCQDCHGDVAQRDRLEREKDLTMGGCMSCHRVKKVSNDCTFCHEQRK